MTAVGAHIKTAADSSSVTVPGELPPLQPTPEPACRVNFAISLLTYWMRPRRVGPHLAMGGFAAAVAAGLLSLAVSAAIVCMISAWGPGGLAVGAEGLRKTVAWHVLVLAESSIGSNWGWLQVLFIFAIPLEILIICAGFGLLLFPWAADGDTLSSAMKRSVKIALWSLTLLIPLSVAWTLVHRLLSGIAATGMSTPGDSLIEGILYNTMARAPNGWAANALNDEGKLICYGLLPVFCVIAYLRLYFSGAARYVGPARGPGFVPRSPLCRACGYSLVGLPWGSKCPECGQLIELSLKGAELSELALGRTTDLHGYLRLQWFALRKPDFLESVSVRQGWSAARRYWWLTCISFSVLLALLALLAMLSMGQLFPRAKDIGLVGVVVFLPVVVHIAATFSTCLWAKLRYGIADPRVSLVLTCYAAPIFWPWVIILCLAYDSLAFVHPAEIVFQRGSFELNMAMLLSIILGSSLLATFVVWRRRIDRALAAARFSN